MKLRKIPKTVQKTLNGGKHYWDRGKLVRSSQSDTFTLFQYIEERTGAYP